MEQVPLMCGRARNDDCSDALGGAMRDGPKKVASRGGRPGVGEVGSCSGRVQARPGQKRPAQLTGPSTHAPTRLMGWQAARRPSRQGE